MLVGTLLGALGGDRLDHELANLLLLADPDLSDVPVITVRGGTSVRVLRPGSSLDVEAEVGDLVSLLPRAVSDELGLSGMRKADAV